MRDTLWLIQKTMLSTFRNYKSWLLYFGLPLLSSLLALMVVQGGADAPPPRIAVVIEDGESAVVQGVVETIARTGSSVSLSDSWAQTRERIVRGELDAGIRVPAGFQDRMLRGESAQVELDSVKGAQATGYLKSVLERYFGIASTAAAAAGGDSAAFERLLASFASSEFRFEATTIHDQSVDRERARQTIGYLLVLMLFGASTLSGIMIKERENRTLLRISAAPAKANAYVMSNVAVSFVIMLAQITATLAFMTGVLGIDPGVGFWALLLLLASFAVAAIGLSLLLVAFSKSSMGVSAAQNLIIMPSSILAGCMFPVAMMPETMQRIAALMPQYWVLETMLGLQQGQSLGSLSMNLLLLLAFALAFLLIAAYKVGRANDMTNYV